MRKNVMSIGFLSLIILSMSTFDSTYLYAETDSQKCWNNAMTQMAMNNCASQDYQSEDVQLNETYQQIELKYQKNPSFLAALKTSEEIWLKFRDAQLAMMYPPELPGNYGSDCEMCQWEYLSQLTHSRTSELKKWLIPPDDSDVCTGSIGEVNSSQ